MEYNFLQNFSSLLEVYTAIYVSIFLDDVLANVWTPDYKKKISNLIRGMHIPLINVFCAKVVGNIDNNVKEIRGHMKRKAVFLFSFCMSLLLIAGLEAKSEILPTNGYSIVLILSLACLIIILLGRWVFIKYSRVVFVILLYSILFLVLYFSDSAGFISGLLIGKIDEYKVSTSFMLLVLTIPIIWQIFLVWVYSRLYKGYMHEKISRESYIYGKAYIAYKLRDLAALPKEYEIVAKDFVTVATTNGDTSLHLLNMVLISRLEKLCELPNVLKVFISWVCFILRGCHTREAEYIEKNGHDYEIRRGLRNKSEEKVESQTDVQVISVEKKRS